jgi:type IV pilus assembly protein PilM
VLPVFSYPHARVVCCDAERVTFGVFARKGGRLICQRHESVKIPAAPAGQSAGLPEALRSFRRGSERPEPVTVVLPSHLVFSRHLRIPRVNGRKRAKIVGFEAGQSIPCPLDEVAWGSVVSGENATTQEVLLSAAKLAVVEPLCAALRDAGFAPRRIVPFPLALLAACRHAHAFTDEPELVLHLGSRAATLLLVTARNFAVRTWLLPTDIHAAGAEALTSQVAQETIRTVLHLCKQSDMAGPVRLLLAGGAGPKCDEVVLARCLKMPVQKINLLEGVAFTAGIEPVADAAHGSWTELLGAAAISMDSSHPAVDLLPPGLRKSERRRRRLPWLAAAAALVLAAPVGPLVHYQRLARAAEEKLRDMEAALTPVRMRDATNRARLVELENLQRSIAVWQAVHERRTSWLTLLADLQQRLDGVGDVWLERMQVLPPADGGPLKIAVTGRMLDRANPVTRFSTEASARMKTLLRTLDESPHFSGVEGERFDSSQAGLLGFELVLVTDTARPL